MTTQGVLAYHRQGELGVHTVTLCVRLAPAHTHCATPFREENTERQERVIRVGRHIQKQKEDAK